MIGDGWDGDPSVRPESARSDDDTRRRVAVVTGSRAEYGLLRPVMRAIDARGDLQLQVIASGSHLIPPALTFRDVKRDFEISDSVPMQVAGRSTRFDDAESVGRGVARFARSFQALDPHWVVVLGDRIEAFAAASAASIGGRAVAHLHGGDRAEGVSDEAMRHAITKLAHLHLPASEQSGERIRRMGERPEHVRVVGSPALDELPDIEPLDDHLFEQLGSPDVLVLFHPVGRHPEEEEHTSSLVLEAAGQHGRVLALHPNHDAGRNGILRAIQHSGVRAVEHLPRDRFVGLLKRMASGGGVLVGNSSAALIEAAALKLACVDVGPRQGGREHASNVVHVDGGSGESIAGAIGRAKALDLSDLEHPYGDGRTGERVAQELAAVDPRDRTLLRKRIVY